MNDNSARSATGTTNELSSPVDPRARYEIIDIIRGFALFGVLVANMVMTTQDLGITEEMRVALPTVRLDNFSLFLTGTFIDGKFFTLFSMLFGLGFAVQLSRAAHREVSVLPTYIRRLGILFIFGAAHGLLLWFGDVLHVYALLGLVLILFRNQSDRTILLWAFGILLFLMGLPTLNWFAEANGWEDTMIFGRVIAPSEMYESLRHGGYAEILRLNWRVHLQDYGEFGFNNILLWYLDIFSKFLFGFYVGRRKWLQHVQEHNGHFRRVLPWALVIGLAGNAFMYAGWVYDIGRPESDFARAVMRSLHEVWVLSLSIGYVCALVLIYQSAPWRFFITCLAPLGRMALTNYLSQSVFLLALFYGIGFGLLGEVGAGACLALSVMIIAVQITLSAWWLNRFQFGPMEWLWRSLTYAKLQPLQKKSNIDVM